MPSLLALGQVHSTIVSKEWEARIAAGECLGLLAEQAPHAAAHLSQQNSVRSDCEASQSREAEGLLKIADFNFEKVLAQGEPLVSASSQVSTAC